MSLKITKVKITNVLGIEELLLEPGKNRTVIKGRNGAGKSTILAAISNVLEGKSSLARLSRLVDGEPQEPEVVLVLDGEDGKKEITKSDDGTPTIKGQVGKSAAMEAVKKPGDFLRTIFDQGANPAVFLTSPAKVQVELLLGALALKWDEEAVRAILGEFTGIVDADNLPLEHLHPLQRIEAIRESVYKARTGVNVTVKAKRSAADQTRRDAPAEVPEGVDARISEKRREIETLSVDVTTENLRITSNFRARVDSAAATRDAEIQKANAEFDKAVSAAKEDAAEARAAIVEETRKLDRANDDLSRLLRDQNDATKARTMHENAATFDRAADSLAGQAERMTSTIKALESAKADMASNIPIVGLTLEPIKADQESFEAKLTKTRPLPEIHIGGIPFGLCNTATRVAVAVAVATLRAKDTRLKALFVDGLEALDAAHREHLYAVLEQQGVQLFAAEVSDGDLEIEKA